MCYFSCVGYMFTPTKKTLHFQAKNPSTGYFIGAMDPSCLFDYQKDHLFRRVRGAVAHTFRAHIV